MSTAPASINVAIPHGSPAQRVAVYVDSLNLYYGLRPRGWHHYYWLDVPRLAQNLLRHGQRLVIVRTLPLRCLPTTVQCSKR